MTRNKIALKLVEGLARKLIFDSTEGDILGDLRECDQNDLLNDHIMRIGEFGDNDADMHALGKILMSARLWQLSKR